VSKVNFVHGKTRVKIDFTRSRDSKCLKYSDVQWNSVGRVGIYIKNIYRSSSSLQSRALSASIDNMVKTAM
jgi:hypothetical protein